MQKREADGFPIRAKQIGELSGGRVEPLKDEPVGRKRAGRWLRGVRFRKSHSAGGAGQQQQDTCAEIFKIWQARHSPSIENNGLGLPDFGPPLRTDISPETFPTVVPFERVPSISAWPLVYCLSFREAKPGLAAP